MASNFLLLLAQDFKQRIHGVVYGFFVGWSGFFGNMVIAGNDQSNLAVLVVRRAAILEERDIRPDDFIVVFEEFTDFFLYVLLQIVTRFKMYTLDVDGHILHAKG